MFDYSCNSVCHHISTEAALVYACMNQLADQSGHCLESDSRLSVRTNIDIDDIQSVIESLIIAELIVQYEMPAPIAEFPGYGVIMGSRTVYQLTDYKRPDKIARLSPKEWNILRAETFERDDFTCRYCGIRGGRLECDHLIALHQGGTNEPSNLFTACFSCNRSKKEKLLADWAGKKQQETAS